MQTLSTALHDYVDAFLKRAKEAEPDQRQITIPASLAGEASRLGVEFKTSFGRGSSAKIRWLACLAPRQSVSVEGVMPVILYELAEDRLTVVYGISATGKAANGEWPRNWPSDAVSGLKMFAVNPYAASLILKQFTKPSSVEVADISASFAQVITDFARLLRPAAPTRLLDRAAVEDFADAAGLTGMTLDARVLRRFVAACATKRFCILTGLAGSGKTKLAEALAIWLSPSADHFRVVVVGADWTNNEPLLGYADALQPGVYRKPANGALDLMLRAAADPAQPYFLVLDEMNLSHVERYFADVLAAIESANAPLALHGQPGVMASDGDESPGVPGRLPLPRNLFIIGTVNVDETTYTFSPKVLDRANVIEFRATRDQLDAFLDEPVRLNLSALQDADGRGLGAAVGPALVEAATSDHDSDALGDDKPAFKEALLEAFDLLADMGAEFGFRSALEMARFAAIHKALGGDDWHWTAALDAQVLQKLLPRLHGSARKLEPVLNKLHGFCTKHALADSLEKIERMQKRLGADGFASFAEN